MDRNALMVIVTLVTLVAIAAVLAGVMYLRHRRSLRRASDRALRRAAREKAWAAVVSQRAGD